MSDIKYTPDGKKVSVVGKLNNTEWIVQEIYVSNGNEFPAGENFICNSLLDTPAITWKAADENRLDERCGVLKNTIEELESKKHQAQIQYDKQKLINKILIKYQDCDVEQLDTLLKFMTGRITHVIVNQYGNYKICDLTDEITDMDGNRIDGIRLVTLFGCRKDTSRYENDKSLSLNWKLNRWRDDSGSWQNIIPCESHEDAVQTLDLLIEDKDANDTLIKLKEKYRLFNPSQKKIDDYRIRVKTNLQKTIEEQELKLDELRDKLTNME